MMMLVLGKKILIRVFTNCLLDFGQKKMVVTFQKRKEKEMVVFSFCKVLGVISLEGGEVSLRWKS